MIGNLAALSERDLLAGAELLTLMLARTTATFAGLPVLGERGVPIPVRVGLCAVLSLIVMPTLPAQSGLPERWDRLVLGVLGEVMVGLALGWIIQSVFEAVAIGCHIVETEVGMSLGGAIAPGSAGQGTLGAFYHMVAVVLFFTSGAYRLLLRGLAESFRALPPGTLLLGHTVGLPVDDLAGLGSGLFVFAVRVAAPLTGVILLADIALGLLARAVPQMNVFAVGFSIKIATALCVAVTTLPLFAREFRHDMHVVLAGVLAGVGRI